jgi:hypothetical protein
LELEADRVTPSIQRIPYDVEAVARKVAEVGLPEEYAAKLLTAS